MSLSRRRFIMISAGLALGATAGSVHAKPDVWRGVVLGAEAKLILTGLPVGESQRLIRLAIAEVDRLENILSIYRSDSVLSQLNRNGHSDMPPAGFLAVLSLAKSIHRSTGGYFDPTVQKLWMAYAQHRGKPPMEVLQIAQNAVGMNKVHFDATSVHFEHPDMAMTFNGIAQGFVTDRIVALLKSEGLRNAVVNMGEIAALGHNQQRNPWQIGVAEHSDLEAEEFVSLSNHCVATSAPHATTFDGVTSHIINPVEGQAAQSPWRRVSVIHKSAGVADGLSTGFVLMDEDQIRVVAEEYGGLQIIAKAVTGHTVRLSS